MESGQKLFQDLRQKDWLDKYILREVKEQKAYLSI